jgi:hypothetical protein
MVSAPLFSEAAGVDDGVGHFQRGGCEQADSDTQDHSHSKHLSTLRLSTIQCVQGNNLVAAQQLICIQRTVYKN